MDEYDKISQNPDIVSALLHITDFSQNDSFQDSYLSELSIDLSCLWFVYSMNELPDNDALRDRIYAIEINGYTEKERSIIVSSFLFPKHVKSWHGMDVEDIKCPVNVATHLIRKISPNDKGIRNIENGVKEIISKLCYLKTMKDSHKMYPSIRNVQFPLVLTNDIIDVLLHDWQSRLNPSLHMYS